MRFKGYFLTENSRLLTIQDDQKSIPMLYRMGQVHDRDDGSQEGSDFVRRN